MTETKARFCDVCGRLVDKQHATRGTSGWQDKYGSCYWQSKDSKTIVCHICYEPLESISYNIGSVAMIELCNWILNPDEGNICDF